MVHQFVEPFGLRCLQEFANAAATSNSPTSADRYAGERWAYRMTMRRPRWPRSSATDRSEAPFMISQEAKVCRRSCQVKSLISATASAVWNPFLTSLTVKGAQIQVRDSS